MVLSTNQNTMIKCPHNHIDTYKVLYKDLKSFWKKGWVQSGVYLIGCNVCEDFYQIDRYEYFTLKEREF